MFCAGCSGVGTERVLPLKESKKRSFPRPRGGQDAIRGKLLGGVLCFPRKFRATGTDHSTPPRNASPALGAQPEAAPLPPRSARHAGGGFPGFADPTTWGRSARYRNLLRGMLNFTVLHVSFPGSFA